MKQYTYSRRRRPDRFGTDDLPARNLRLTRNVVATDMRECKALGEADGPFEVLDALDATAVASVVARHRDRHDLQPRGLAVGRGRAQPPDGLERQYGRAQRTRSRWRASTIARSSPPARSARSGPRRPRTSTPQDTVMQPTTIYGICKVTGEMLGNYYHHKYGVDTRSVRFPGIISNVTLPGGGTTDYAVEIYYEAMSKSASYTCPVPPRRLYGHDLHARRAARLRRTDGGRPREAACTATVSTSRR